MSRIWRGPSPDLVATYTDPVCQRLHRRAGERGICYEPSDDGRSATVFAMRTIGDRTVVRPIGAVTGADAIDTFINANLKYVETDDEILGLIGLLIARRRESVIAQLTAVIRRIAPAIESRYV
jgi:hypothetical protein